MPYSRDDFQLVVEGIRGEGYQGDIAVDDISLTPGCQICTSCTMPGISMSNLNVEPFSRFPKNGHTAWFDTQTKKLEPQCITKQTAPHESTVQ